MLPNNKLALRASALFFFIAILALTGCQMDQFENFKSFRQGKITTIEATYELPVMDTKTVRDDNAKIYWTPGDAISLFYGSGADGGSKFTAQNEAVSLKTTFAGYILAVTGGSDIDDEEDYFWGLYPYDETASCDGKAVTVTIPAVQPGMDGTFAPGYAPSLGHSKGLTLSFRNIWSGFGFTVSEAGFQSVTFRGNAGENIAGKARIGLDENSLPKVLEILEGIQEVTLTAPKGGFVPGQYYYMQFFPCTFESGFSVELVGKTKKGTYYYTKSMDYPRSTWKRAADVDTRVENWDNIDPTSEIISFEDEDLKAKLVAAFDTDGDGELSYSEAAAVTDASKLRLALIPTTTYKSFDEFQYFTGITEVRETMFEGWKIKSIILPESIDSIGGSAFKGCSELTSIVIPEGVKTVPISIFEGCEKLTKVTIPEGVTSIGNYAFYDCTSLTAITIPERVTTIGFFAFYGCSSLNSILIPESVISIGTEAFRGCTSLTAITIPERVTTIGGGVFRGCTSLTSITIPEDVTRLNDHLFWGCSSLTSITIPEGVTWIGDNAFYDCTSLIAITIPEGVTWIGKNAFGYTSLTSITIPEGVKRIPEQAFRGCTSLTSITIPKSVTTIGSCAFLRCTSLTSITVPENVTWIDSGAFGDCTSLTYIIIMATDVPGASDNIFNNTNNCPIYVPAESIELYKKATNWSKYASRIQAF